MNPTHICSSFWNNNLLKITFEYYSWCDIADENYDSALENITKGLALSNDKGKQDLYFNEIVVYEKKLDFATAKEKAAKYVKNYPADEAGIRENNFLKTR